MKFVLIIVFLGSNSMTVSKPEPYANMDDCFDRRDDMVETIGRPIVNYQAVCIISDNRD